jgi:hypothetical protein
MHVFKQALAVLLLSTVLAACQWLRTPGTSPDTQAASPASSPSAAPATLPGLPSEAPRLSPSIEIPPPLD